MAHQLHQLTRSWRRWIAMCEIAWLCKRAPPLKDTVGRVCLLSRAFFLFIFFPEKEERRKGGKISQTPERGGEIVIQQASDGCQAVLLHCRCDASIHSSFSSLSAVSSSTTPPPLPLFSTFLSFIFLISFPHRAHCLLSLHASAHSVFSLSLVLHFSLSCFSFLALCPPTPPPLTSSPSSFFYPSSQWR